MVICKFYQAGRCRYGDNCKFEHIDPPGGARNNQSNSYNQNDPFSTPNRRENYRSNKTTEDHPQWPLSVIGIKDDTQQGNALTGDWSPEELRAIAYSMAPRGLSNEVTQRETQMVAEHQAKVDALSRGGMQTHAPTSNSQPKDPFAQDGGASGFGGGFGRGNSGGSASQGGFGQPGQQQPIAQQSNTGNAFGQGQPFSSPPQQGAPFSQPQSGFAQPQPPAAPASQPAAPVSSAAQEQFSAAQFGFSKVPESAPPPQFY